MAVAVTVTWFVWLVWCGVAGPSAIADCTEALKVQADCVKALVRRGTAYINTEHYELAVADLTSADALLAGSDAAADLQAQQQVWSHLRYDNLAA